MPAYKVDWDDYNRHKLSGGTFANYTKKEYQPLNDAALKEHFIGKTTIGVYPLLSDNTSFFIAADFDEANWQESILKLYKICQDVELPAVIERSRSGNGGHLGLFFEENIPAFQSRKILFELLMQSEIVSKFEKEPSFDRLFPNQDTHSGKGIGNLIALPLQGNSLSNGNSCFLNPDTFDPIEDQWAFNELRRGKPRGIKWTLFFVSDPRVGELNHFNIKNEFMKDNPKLKKLKIQDMLHKKKKVCKITFDTPSFLYLDLSPFSFSPHLRKAFIIIHHQFI